jgi:HEPN domain-containing protein
MTDADYIDSWFLKAEQDLKIIEQGMDRPKEDWVSEVLCFHAQQAAEKALKAFLIAKRVTPPRTHSIEILLEQCHQADPSFPNFDIRNLSYFSVEIRYPDELYQPEAEETRYYAELSRRIVTDMKLRTRS